MTKNLEERINLFCKKKGFAWGFEKVIDNYVNKFVDGSYVGFTYQIVIDKYRRDLNKYYKLYYDKDGNKRPVTE